MSEVRQTLKSLLSSLYYSQARLIRAVFIAQPNPMHWLLASWVGGMASSYQKQQNRCLINVTCNPRAYLHRLTHAKAPTYSKVQPVYVKNLKTLPLVNQHLTRAAASAAMDGAAPELGAGCPVEGKAA